MTDKANIPEAIKCLSIRHEITSLINYLLCLSSLPNSSVENANLFCFVLLLLFQLKKFKIEIYIYIYLYTYWVEGTRIFNLP